MEGCSFWERYKTDIMPKLEEIDILLKTLEEDLNTEEVSDVLAISEKEVKDIVQRESIQKIDREGFLKIMKQGSSLVCRMFRREMECASPYVYSKEDISYIYEIPLQSVSEACKRIGVEIITTNVLPFLFEHIACQESAR